MTLSKTKWRNTLHSHPVRSPTIFKQATSAVHRKALITIKYYEQRLASCEYNKKLTYQQQGENIVNDKNIGKNRKRHIICFNPHYSKSLKTNIVKYFFILLSKHFPPGHRLYKIFNKNALKLRYSWMTNLKAKIDGHNKKILDSTPPPKTKLCNCLKKENCSMRGACLTKNALYYARISLTMKHINRNFIKESGKLLLKNVTQIIKNPSMRKRTRTILNYLLDTGSCQMRNFTHGYPGL